MFARMWHRAIDGLYSASDASHKARGWEVRKGRFGSRRYRLDVAAWLESRRRVERFGSTCGPAAAVREEAANLWDSMRWTDRDVARVLTADESLAEVHNHAQAAGVPFDGWSYRDEREVA
jgi:hypothetical protein